MNGKVLVDVDSLCRVDIAFKMDIAMDKAAREEFDGEEIGISYSGVCEKSGWRWK